MQAALRPEGYEDVGSVKTWEREFQAEGATRAQAQCAWEGERETGATEKGERPKPQLFNGHFKESVFHYHFTVL